MSLIRTRRTIFLIAAFLFSNLACRAAMDLVLPTLPTVETRAFPEPIDCPDDSCLGACLNRLDEALESKPLDPIGNPIYEEQGANFDLVIYKVSGDEIIEPTILYVPSEYRKYQEDMASHRRIWDFYVAVIPPELRKLVNEFVIFTDGSGGGSAAWVRPSAKDSDYWQVGFDLLDSDYPLFLADMLVHETGHLLTLNKSQIMFDEDVFFFFDGKENRPACPQYVVDGGCSRRNSYINLFYQGFWKTIHEEWWEMHQEAQRARSDEEYYKIMERFYYNHPELFLNGYAATNITEDLAESFPYFVLHVRSPGKTIPEKKVEFFYEFPELVEYRQEIIEGLCSYVR